MREGLVPTVLGVAVTTGAVALRAMDMKKRGIKRKEMLPMAETAALGFGLAHIVLGTIDLIDHR
ncbi:asparagine synthase [Clostridium aciditolerans]|uniref:Asparagine synthase n=1 Tax=Clostridium aciditolerans TaxID=339861 RepID=A0A934HVK3_9CLOT|nr:asparagine synthase [Clostridium aciditolerans]MBI6871628.1 asparagine synthase [Clostridium aciditolerans]